MGKEFVRKEFRFTRAKGETPKPLISNSVAWMVCQKYENVLPLYCQEGGLEVAGIVKMGSELHYLKEGILPALMDSASSVYIRLPEWQ